MKTPIADFIREYSRAENARFHMPGHKGRGGDVTAYDITEISGADSLYDAEGIIKESEIKETSTEAKSNASSISAGVT